MINRNIENIIRENLKHYPIVLLTGPRQIGKSTLIYNAFSNSGFDYVTLDDILELSMAISDPITFLEIHKPPLIIDEAQKAPELFPIIEQKVNQSRLQKGNKESNGLYILSGSQIKILLDQSEESLSGRVAILDMSNLSLSEIFSRCNKPFKVEPLTLSQRANDYKITSAQAFKYITRGFFPVLYDDLEMKSSLFYSSYIQTYLEKDLKEYISITDEIKFISFLRILASNTGEELIYENYSKQVGVALNTIKSWIAVLVKTGIIYLIHPYNEESIVKRIIKRPKLYFFDTGLAAYLCGIDAPETLENSFLKGRFFETFVFNEIRKTFLNNGDVRDLFYYRDIDQNEIDLVLIIDGKISCVEIKCGQFFNASSTKSFIKLQNSKFSKGKNAIICTSDKISIIEDGTLILPLSSI